MIGVLPHQLENAIEGLWIEKPHGDSAVRDEMNEVCGTRARFVLQRWLTQSIRRGCVGAGRPLWNSVDVDGLPWNGSGEAIWSVPALAVRVRVR